MPLRDGDVVTNYLPRPIIAHAMCLRYADVFISRVIRPHDAGEFYRRHRGSRREAYHDDAARTRVRVVADFPAGGTAFYRIAYCRRLYKMPSVSLTISI